MKKEIDYHELRIENPIKYWFLQNFFGYPYIDVKNNDATLYY